MLHGELIVDQELHYIVLTIWLKSVQVCYRLEWVGFCGGPSCIK